MAFWSSGLLVVCGVSVDCKAEEASLSRLSESVTPAVHWTFQSDAKLTPVHLNVSIALVSLIQLRHQALKLLHLLTDDRSKYLRNSLVRSTARMVFTQLKHSLGWDLLGLFPLLTVSLSLSPLCCTQI